MYKSTGLEWLIKAIHNESSAHFLWLLDIWRVVFILLHLPFPLQLDRVSISSQYWSLPLETLSTCVYCHNSYDASVFSNFHHLGYILERNTERLGKSNVKILVIEESPEERNLNISSWKKALIWDNYFQGQEFRRKPWKLLPFFHLHQCVWRRELIFKTYIIAALNCPPELWIQGL